jgi:hypothetical protein
VRDTARLRSYIVNNFDKKGIFLLKNSIQGVYPFHSSLFKNPLKIDLNGSVVSENNIKIIFPIYP